MNMSNSLQCELVSWTEVKRLCWRLARLVKDSDYRPDIVIAIARGGYVPARLVCDALDIMALTSIKIEHYLTGSDKQAEAVMRYPLCVPVEGQRVLIVDDVNDSGDTLQLALQHVQKFHPGEVRTAVMHDKRVTHYRVDYFAKRIIKWRWLIYPWAMNEDITAFLKRLQFEPHTMAEAQQGLAEQFGIRISTSQLGEICALNGLFTA